MKHAQCASIKVIDGHAEITPNKNLGPEKGFEPIVEETIAVPIIDSKNLGRYCSVPSKDATNR